MVKAVRHLKISTPDAHFRSLTVRQLKIPTTDAHSKKQHKKTAPESHIKIPRPFLLVLEGFSDLIYSISKGRNII